MEEKRASLAEKLDTLENHVLGTVHEATDAVAHTVEDVKSAVDHTVEDVKSVVDTVKGGIQDTVENVSETVKHTFDVPHHFRRHPWGMFCGSVAVGFVGGRLLAPAQSEKQETPPAPAPTPAPSPRPARRAERGEGQSGVNEILERVRGLALGAVMGMVRDFLSESLPETLKADVLNVVDDITTKLGGKPLPKKATSSNGAHPAPSSGASGEQTDEERTPNGAGEPQSTSEESRPQGNKKGQASGGRFDRRNPPPRR